MTEAPKVVFIKRPKTSEGGAAKAAGQSSKPAGDNNSHNGKGRRSPKPQGESASASAPTERKPITLKKREKKDPTPNPIADPAIQSLAPASPSGHDSVGTPASETTPVDVESHAIRAPRGVAQPMEQCDLCQKDIPEGTIPDHVSTQHKGLINCITKFTHDILALRDSPVNLSKEQLEAFGRYIEADVLPSDQGPEVFKRALAAHDQVSRLVLRRFPTCKVFMFGSSIAMGSWDGSGDIDLTLVDAEGWDKGTWPPKGDAEGSTILRLAGICREGGFSHDDLEPLRRVRVPVLKHKRPFKLDLTEHTGSYEIIVRFQVVLNANQRENVEHYFKDISEGGRWRDTTRYIVSYKTGLEAFEAYMSNHKRIPTHTVYWNSFTTAPEMFGIDFDLSARAHGIRNSWLLRKYMEQSSLVRAGSVFLKHWSKNSAVNYSMKGYFTSYAINMLWVNFLLHRGLVKFIDPVADVEGSAAKSPVAGTYIPLIEQSDKDSPAFLQDVSQAVYEFFCYYAYEFDWDTNVVSVCRKGVTTKASLGWTEESEKRTGAFRDRCWYRVCIEDPFEANLNLGRHASTVKALKIRSQFFRAALVISKGDFKSILVDNTTMSAMERLQRQFPRQMLLRKNNATYEEILEAIAEVDPDVLAAVETEYIVDQLAAHCGCMVEDDHFVTPLAVDSLANSNVAQELVESTDVAVKEAGAMGLPITPLHDVNNLHPLYFSSPNSKRLFVNGKHMRRFDEHLRAIMALLPSTKDELTVRIKEKVPKVDAAVVENILKDSRFVSFDGRNQSYTVTKKAAEAAQSQKDSMDVATKQFGNCDDCGKRAPVYASTKGGKSKFCEPCWDAYLASTK